MRIKRIEYKNFKCYPKLILPKEEGEVFPEGLFLVQGNTPLKSNSYGKTSLIDGILFGFFGPKSLPLKINNLITFGKTEGEVKIIFEVNGVDYLIHRNLIRRGKSGNHKSNFYVKHNGSWRPDDTLDIEELLEIKRDQALKTVFVKQGEIEHLASARPTALRDLIITLFRLDIMAYARDFLSKLREKDKKRLKEIEKIFVPPSEIELNIKENQKKKERKEKELSDTKEVIEKLKKLLETHPKKEYLTEITTLKQSGIELVNNKEFYTEQIKEKTDSLELEVDLTISKIDNLIIEKEKIISDKRKEKDKLDKDSEKLNEDINKNKGLISGINNSKAKLQKNIVFEDGETEAMCPTCSRKISYQEAQEFLKSYDQEIAQINQNNEMLLPEKDKIDGKLDILSKNFEEIEEVISILKSIKELVNKRTEADKEIQENRKSLTKLLGQFEVSTEEDLFTKFKSDSLEALRDKITTLESDYKNKIELSERIQKEILDFNKTLIDLKEKKRKMESLSQERDLLEKRRIHIRKNKELVKGFITEYMVEKRLLTNIQYSTNKYLEYFTGGQYTNLNLISIKVSGHSGLEIKVFDEYNRISKEKYYLSGGDKVALGFALRIGISKLMTKIRPTRESPPKNPKISILMLDEPLAALDTERRTQVLTTLESQKEFNQIFLITHTDIPESVNPHLIKISKNFSTGLSNAIFIEKEKNIILEGEKFDN